VPHPRRLLSSNGVLFIMWYGAIYGAENTSNIFLLRTLLGTGSPVAKSLTSVREYNSSAMP
jgi:hypothetical protein